jgi:hypothetical protein
MASKLRPLGSYLGGKYPKAEKGLFRGLLVASAMAATSLGGCGPGIDSRSVDDALDASDLDGTVEDCDGSTDPNCDDSGAPGSGSNSTDDPNGPKPPAE